MKKSIIVYIMVHIIIIFLISCNRNMNDQYSSHVNVDISEVYVVRQWILNGDEKAKLNISLYNGTYNEIEGLEFVALLFDENGKPIITKKHAYDLSDVKAINAISFQKNSGILKPMTYYHDEIQELVDKEAKFAKIYIKKIIYSNGTKWENAELTTLLNKEFLSYDIMEGRNTTQVISNADKAKKVPPITINQVSSEAMNTKSMCKILFTNSHEEKVIKRIQFLVIMFDENNKPVQCSDRKDMYLADNVQLLTKGDLLVEPKSELTGDDYYWEIELKAKNIKVTPINIQYTDGTVWNNEFIYDWINVERYNY